METSSGMTTLSVWLALGMTSFLVTSRVTLLWLLRLYKYEQVHPATWYLVVLVLLQAPHLSSLVHLLWNTPLISAINRESLPTASHVALGVLASFLEALVTALFATEVAHVLPEPVLLTLPYSTLAFVILKDILVEQQRRTKKVTGGPRSVLSAVSKLVSFLVFCFTFLVAAAVGAILCGWTDFRLSVGACVVLATSVLILSSVWSPAVQRVILLSHKTRGRCLTVDFVYIPVKVATVTLTVFLSLFFKLDDFRSYLHESFNLAIYELSDFRVWLPLVMCCLSSLFSLMTASAASKVCLMKPGMKIPLFLCPVLAVMVTAVLWNDFETKAFWEVAGEGVYAWTAIGLATTTWLIPFLLPSFRGFMDPKSSNRDVNESFYSISWNTFFLEPRMVLSYDSRGVGKHSRKSAQIVNTSLYRKRTVYICTTMYKETMKEMRRYVRSVHNVFANNDKDKVDLEAHVFFDSSVHDDIINSRGRLLLTLLCDTFQLRHNDLTKLATPYGCQVRTTTPNNYPMFIHFKDPAKVKAKKRWSQVMYMHYVLKFRNLKLNKPLSHTNFISNSEKVNEYQKNAFNAENDFIFHNCPITNIYEIGASNSFTKLAYASEAPSPDIRFTPMKRQCLSADPFWDVKGGRNCCYSDNNSFHALSPSQPLDVGDKRERSTVPLLASLYRSVTDCSAPNCGLWLGAHSGCAGRKQAGYDGSILSTETSDRGSSRSSDAENDSKTCSLSSLEETSVREDPKFSQRDNMAALNDVYVLTTDADTEFSAKSIQHLLEQCESEPSLGAVCGRTVPIGSAKPIVWYQKFEYAKDFWLVKSSQNVIGSVTCCPGCFSLYRGSAIASILEEFSQPACSAFDSLVMDHGEDRWLCTLLMQRGWRLAYSSHAHNSTQCPETMGEFLRQRRRWVLSELSNMAAIFVTVPSLVRNNPSFSGMFLISLLTTFLWVILSPSTTLVFMCAGMEVLFSISMTMTLPVATALFTGYCAVCCLASQRKQKLVFLVVTCVMALVVVTLGAGFILYVVKAARRDIQMLGSVQFQPYFLVFLLVTSIVYAALLHPKESLSLVYGLAYALLFPAMFVVLPGYALSNMLDQSWGTREAGSHGCCQGPLDDADEDGSSDFMTVVSSLPSLATSEGGENEEVFWEQLVARYLGKDVNKGKSDVLLCHDLHRLRRWAVSIFVAVNLVWFSCLSALYACAGSDVICYCVAAVFSFSLLVQLIGLTCYKCNIFLSRYLLLRSNIFVTRESRQ